MPKIKLIQEQGEYTKGDSVYHAGEVYDVDNKTAYYLITLRKVAVEVGNAPTKERPSVPASTLAPTPAPVPTPVILTNNDEQGKLKIALVRVGGIGDSLESSLLAVAVKKKYPNSIITCFIRNKAGRDLIYDNPSVDKVVIIGQVHWAQFVVKLTNKDFDIIYDSRYVTKVIYKEGNPGFDEEKKKTDKAFEPFQKFYETFPLSCNTLTNEYKQSSHSLVLKTACLTGSDDDLSIRLDKEDLKMLPLLESNKFVTVHNGADISRQTKCWGLDNWTEVVKSLNIMGFTVVQLGSKYEDIIPGAISMNGKTNIKECAALISKAEFHIDTEGGLVHMARAVGTRSIVLFGPTPIHFFGYKENVNIQSPYECKECWWTTDFWWRECPKGYPLPTECMEAITSEKVMASVDAIIDLPPINPPEKEEVPYDTNDLNEKFAMEMELNEAHYKAESWQFDRIETMLGLVKGQDVLEVGAGDGYCVSLLKKRGFNVTATEISKIRLKRMKQSGIDAQWANVNELPFPDNSFDTVIVGEVLEHLDSMAKGLTEAERVCRPDGKIIISLPVAREHDLFEGHKWAIDHHSILKQGSLNMIVLGLNRINR